MTVELTADDARRVAVTAQLLAGQQLDGVLDVVRRLTLLQVDQTRAVAPSPDVVLWSRLGQDYDPVELVDLRETQQLLELDNVLRPAEDIALYRAEMDAFVDLVRHGGQSPCSVDDALAALVVAEAAVRSRRENRPVHLVEMGA